jgi:hypothetical protein
MESNKDVNFNTLWTCIGFAWNVAFVENESPYHAFPFVVFALPLCVGEWLCLTFVLLVDWNPMACTF